VTASAGDLTVELIQGDITHVKADAIVNAANAHLAGGGGVDGAIHRAGGPSIMEECRRLGGCPTGSAVHTGAGRLTARHVIHAVAPRWKGGNANEAALLAGAYRTAMELAERLGDRTIAFPSLGTGAYGYPVHSASQIALQTVRKHAEAGTEISRVVFVLFTAGDLSVFQSASANVFGS
jgi:O-acetyl-ADP-ribose deacetylase (regulator of RNase III)